jgi:hypothetical protein
MQDIPSLHAICPLVGRNRFHIPGRTSFQTPRERAKPPTSPVARPSSCPAGRDRRSRSRGGQRPRSDRDVVWKNRPRGRWQQINSPGAHPLGKDERSGAINQHYVGDDISWRSCCSAWPHCSRWCPFGPRRNTVEIRRAMAAYRECAARGHVRLPSSEPHLRRRPGWFGHRLVQRGASPLRRSFRDRRGIGHVRKR